MVSGTEKCIPFTLKLIMEAFAWPIPGNRSFTIWGRLLCCSTDDAAATLKLPSGLCCNDRTDSTLVIIKLFFIDCVLLAVVPFGQAAVIPILNDLHPTLVPDFSSLGVHDSFPPC